MIDKKDVLISIVIPSYNHEKFINRAIDSVLEQNIENFELIVIDDASKDKTADLVSKYLDDERITLIVNPENLGSFKNNSKAITLGQGKYFVWLHGDDFLLSGHLTDAIDALEKNELCVLAYSPCYWVDDNDNVIKLAEHPGHKQHDYYGGRNEIAELLAYDNYITPSSVVFRKEALDQFSGFDITIRAGDWYLFTQLALKFREFIFFKRASTAYRIHENQFSNTEFYNSEKPLAAHIGILEKALGCDDLKWLSGWNEHIKKHLLHRVSSYSEDTIAPFINRINCIINALDNPEIDSRFMSCDLVSDLRIKSKPLEENPLVSVIVPTMNRPGLLERALRSLVNQAYENLEAVVVNDGGEDVQDIVMSIDSLSRVQYFNLSKNQGASSARNTAIQASKGSVLCYLDDDDVFLPDHIATIVNALQKKNAEFVYCEAVYEVEKGQGQDNNQEVSRTTPYSGISYSKDKLDVSNFIPINTWGHRRELLEKSGLFDTSLLALEDWEMLLRFSRLTDFVHIPKLTVEVHRPASLGKNHLLSRERAQLPQLYSKLYDRYPVDSREVQNKRIALLASWGVDYKPAYSGIGRFGATNANSSLEKILVSYGFLGGSLVKIARTMVKNNPKDFVEKETKHDLYFDVATEVFRRYQEKNEDSQQSSDSALREATHLLSDVLGEALGMKKAHVLREQIAELQQTKDYQLWMRNHQLREIDGQLFAERMVMKWNQKPVFHCIMFLFPGEENLLADTLDSFGSQLYQEWCLTVIAETPAPDPLWEELDVLEWVEFNEGANPYELLNSFVFEMPADWVAIIEPGVRLVPHTLIQVADYINIRPNWKLIYTDEDVIDGQEGYIAPKFKPDFNLDMLRSRPYIGNACFVKRDVLKTLGGYEAYISAENHDISFKVFEQYGEKDIGHIADILFHFPTESKRVLDETTIQKVVQYHLQRSDISAVVQSGYLPGSTRIVYEHNESPLVSIIILNQNRFEYIEPCLKSLFEKTDYPNYEIIIVDFGSTDTDTLELYANMQHLLPDRFSVVNYDGEFNYSAMCNRGMANAKADFVMFLNYDTEVLHPEWLSRMMAHAQRPDVGVVGARLTFPETSKLQHAGQILGLLGGAEQPFCDDLTLRESGYMERAQIVQNYSSVSERCMLVKREAYQAVAGMDEQGFAISFNNVDLCLKIREHGLRVVWTPYSTLVSYGSTLTKTEGGDYLEQAAIIERSKKDRSNLLKKWMQILANDPAYNPNLSLAHRDFRIEMQMPRNWDINFHDRDRILGFPSRGGSGDYRVIQPFDALSMAGIQQSEYYRVGSDNIKTSVDLLEIARLKPDTLVVQAAINDLQMDLVERVSEYLPDIYCIFTIDDLITEVPKKSSAYRSNQRYFKDVRKRLRKVLAKCNRLIVTTQPLADAFSDMIDDVQVIPNRLVRDKWANLKSQRQTSDKPRVGWVGAQQHQGDLEIIYEAVKQTADEVDWVFMGMCPDEIKAYIKEYHEFVVIDQYPEKMASLNLDLAIAPLEVNSFNEAKSNLRLLEYGVLGWPVVCTDIYPYQNCDAPVTRVNNTTDEWVSAIRTHVNDLNMAGQAGDRLRDWVLKNFILEDYLSEWQKALSPSLEKGVTAKTEGIDTAKITPF